MKAGEGPEGIISYGRTDAPDLPATGTVTIEGAVLSGVPQRVVKGYRYYLEVDPDNVGGGINSVEVIYHR